MDEIEMAEASGYNLEEALAELVGEADEPWGFQELGEAEAGDGSAPNASVPPESSQADPGVAGAVDAQTERLASEAQAAEEALVVAEGAPHQPEEGGEQSSDGTIVLSRLGYVTSSRPQHRQVASLGLIGMNSDRRVMWANCHMHPHCNIHCGVVRQSLPRMRLAEWLALGTPSAGLPMPERRRLGAERRQLWRRTGDFPPQSSGSGARD